MLKKLSVVAFLLSVLTSLAWADMASWYSWESQADGRLVCSQWSPGDGWKRFAGPFTNGACRP